MQNLFRFRNLLLIGGSLVICAYLLVSDPNNGNLFLPFIAKLATPVIAVLFAHLARKALFDYVDLQATFKKARETATGSGLVFLGICLIIYGLLGLFGSQVYSQPVATYIPQQAYQHLSTLNDEKVRLWANHPNQNTLVV